MDKDVVRFLLKYFSTPKIAGSTYLRENNSMRELVRKIMEEHNLSKPQRAYELAILSLGLGVPAEEIAPLLRAYKKHSKESLFRVVEQLIEMTYGKEIRQEFSILGARELPRNPNHSQPPKRIPSSGPS